MNRFPVGSRVKISEAGHKEWGHGEDNPECPGTVISLSFCSDDGIRVAFDNAFFNSYNNENQLEPVNAGPLEPVIFRAQRGRHPGVVAVFSRLEQGPYSSGLFVCYTHLNQHCACTKEWYRTTRPAASAEYAPLLEELEARGYNLQIITRWPKAKKENS